MNSNSSKFGYRLIVSLLFVAAAALIVLMTGCSNDGVSGNQQGIKAATTQYATPKPPPAVHNTIGDDKPVLRSARAFATSHHCTNYSGSHTPTQDDGICWIGQQMYVVDTFLTPTDKSDYMNFAGTTGIYIKFQDPTAVIYSYTEAD